MSPSTKNPDACAHQLRSYIFPSAPATRTPCDGAESAMRVEFGFTPRWFHESCGIDFSERWHLDPLFRRATVVSMRQELKRRFPGLQFGGDAPEGQLPTLDGVHGALLVAMIFGIPAVYYADNWPAAQHAYLTEQNIARLEPPDLSRVPVFTQVMAQMDAIERECGRIEGYLNWQGVLNNAFRIRGEAIMTDLVVDPGLAHHLFEVLAETMIAGMRCVYERQAATGIMIKHATVSNCLVNMIAPELYREHVFPYDMKIRNAFEYFGVHNCAWNVDPYIEQYARFPRLGYVDMGLESDLARTKRLCPAARRAVMYTPTDLAAKPLPAIRADLMRIRRELSPCDIVMADIDHGTPDERVIAFAQAAREIAAGIAAPQCGGLGAETERRRTGVRRSWKAPGGWYSRGYLPHFDSSHVIQHVTYHLADSLPSSALERMQQEVEVLALDDVERKAELRQRIDAYLDAGHGSCLLRTPEIAECVVDTWFRFDGERYRLLEWMVMPNHCHVLIEPLAGFPLGKTVLSWKNYTARFINTYDGRRWDRFIRNQRHLEAVTNYIMMNPVSAGLVTRPEDWPWSSARDRRSDGGTR